MHSPEETLFNKRELSHAKAFVHVFFLDPFEGKKMVEIVLDKFDEGDEEDYKKAVRKASAQSGFDINHFKVVRVEKFDPSSEK